MTEAPPLQIWKGRGLSAATAAARFPTRSTLTPGGNRTAVGSANIKKRRGGRRARARAGLFCVFCVCIQLVCFACCVFSYLFSEFLF